MVMLTSALSTMVNNLFMESFDTNFMKNEKNYHNINCFFFPIKFCFKWIVNITLRASVSIFHKHLLIRIFI